MLFRSGSSQIKAATYASTKTGENYGLNNVNYDANGNILALSRSGATNTNYTAFGNVDNLSYTYQSNSNKLLKIADATTTNADLGDFRDGTNTDNDYDYWADGNLKKDKNKGISSLTYNYLKLPQTITFTNGRTITTQYNANGTKLKKIDSNGETTDYEEDEIYVNNVLYQTAHEEGRIANGICEYNINDHLGNLRVSFRDSLGIAVPTQSIFYDPWGLSMKGMQISRSPTNFNKYQFLNRETQFETGYIDLQNRQYDPQRGQFTSQDPLSELSRRFSPMVYGMNNTLRFIDPDGMKAKGYVSASGYYSDDSGAGGEQENGVIERREVKRGEEDDDDKDKGKKKPLPTLAQAMASPHLNPNGDGIQADHTIESIVIPIFRPIGWAFNALKFRFLVNVAAKDAGGGLYAGVRAASKYLQEQGVPRAYRQQILQSFEIETISLRTADNATYGLRFFGGAANETGRYLFPTFTNYTNRVGLALPPSWNSMAGISQFQISEGSSYIFGRAVSQGGIYTGGSYQMFVNSLKDLNK